jgi:hypothetical protein
MCTYKGPLALSQSLFQDQNIHLLDQITKFMSVATGLALKYLINESWDGWVQILVRLLQMSKKMVQS